jgi:hypothetical protein
MPAAKEIEEIQTVFVMQVRLDLVPVPVNDAD